MINFPRSDGNPPVSVVPRQRETSPAGVWRWMAKPAESDRILASGWRSNGPEVEAFEREFADYVGAAEAVAVSSGAAGVELSLRALRLPRGSRVLLSTLASCSVVQAVARAALRPVLLDVSESTGMPTVQHVRDAVRSVAAPVRALVVGHWSGDPSEVAALAEAAGLPAQAVVEDAGLATGGWLEGQPIGGAGSACFSFYATANLPIGEGGMIATDDADRAAMLRYSREHGTSPAARRHVLHGHVGPHVLRDGGLQSGLSEQSAATGRDLLQRLGSRQLRRQSLARRYDELLDGVPGVTLPHRPAPGTGQHGWHLYPVRVQRPRSEREAVVRALVGAGVGTAEAPLPLHRTEFCRDVCEMPADLPGADALVDQVVTLPIHPQIGDRIVDRVGGVLEATLGRRRGVAAG